MFIQNIKVPYKNKLRDRENKIDLMYKLYKIYQYLNYINLKLL